MRLNILKDENSPTVSQSEEGEDEMLNATGVVDVKRREEVKKN